jgi:hypothetical protein
MQREKFIFSGLCCLCFGIATKLLLNGTGSDMQLPALITLSVTFSPRWGISAKQAGLGPFRAKSVF